MPPKQRGFIRYWPVWCFLGVLILFVIAVFARDPLRSFFAGRRLAAEIPRARALGLPLTAKEIYPELAAGTPNAAPQLDTAFALRKKLSQTDKDAINYFGTSK